jgi:predicted  nucleic acid-binding Zn-ribbon protein
VAEGAWRCSQCGTVNEPVANACRTCGRWPSLFELEGSTIETDVPARSAPAVAEDEFPAQTVDVEELEPDVSDLDDVPLEAELPPEFEPDADEPETERSPWRRLVRLVVPIGIVAYILISALADRG